MARPRKPLDEKQEGAEVLRRLRSEPAGWRRERLLAVKFGLENELSLEEIAGAVGRSRSVIQSWLDAFRKGGIEGLLKKGKGNGPASRLGQELLGQLKEGLSKGLWRTAAQVRAWLAGRGVNVALPTVYHYLGKSGARLKVPRPCHALQDKDKLQAFVAAGFEENFRALDLPAGRPVRVWAADEGRLGLQPVTRRMWGLPGVRLVTKVHPRYEWTWVYGALQVGGGGCEFMYAGELNKGGSKAFLEQISRRDPLAVHVVVWDGAGAHPANGGDGVPGNVRLIKLPPYCPELNPVGKLWDVVKDAVCNQCPKSLDDLEKSITDALREFWTNGRRVLELVGGGWLRTLVNACCRSVLPI
jgi:transposase